MNAWMLGALMPLIALLGCTADTGRGGGGSTGDDDSAGGDDDDDTAPCEYPPGSVDPMDLDEVLTAYSWPVAKTPSGADSHLDMDEVHCDEQSDFSWSPFDVLVFVSIPAW